MKKTVIFTLFFSLVMAGALSAQSMTGRQIIELMIDARSADSAAIDMNMVLYDTDGSESVRRLQMLGMEDPSGLDNSVMVFKEPASVKNTRFLMKENDGRNDDQWIYLPALKKVKRIASGEKDNAFMGSDFSYGDMESRDADEDNHSLLREESLNGESVWVVESIPLPGHEIGYSRVISWVSKDSHMPLKVEFYNDKSDALEKTMINEDIRMVDGQWTIYKVTMTDASSGHKTVMSINKVRYNIPVKPGYFTTNYLQTGRAQ